MIEPSYSSCVNRMTVIRGCKQLTWVDSRSRVAWIETRNALGNYMYTGTHVRRSSIQRDRVTVSHKHTKARECPEWVGAVVHSGPRLRISRWGSRSAKCGIEYGIDLVEKLKANIAVLSQSVSGSLVSLSLSHTYASFDPYEKNKVRVIYLQPSVMLIHSFINVAKASGPKIPNDWYLNTNNRSAILS